MRFTVVTHVINLCLVLSVAVQLSKIFVFIREIMFDSDLFSVKYKTQVVCFGNFLLMLDSSI